MIITLRIRNLTIRRVVLPFILVPAAVLFAITLAGCNNSASKPNSRTKLLLGTTCTVSIYQRAKESTFEAVFDRVWEIQQKMSTVIPESEVSAINNNAGIRPVAVSDDTFHVIERGIEFGELSDGAFDISVGPIIELWKIGTEEAEVPRQEMIDAALPNVDFNRIVLDREAGTVFLEKRGMSIDLGGIAKGYAADEAARILKGLGVEHALLDFGGNILSIGNKPDDSLWRIGIQVPEGGRGNFFGILQTGEDSVVTSGVYERYFIEDGKRYHHILDTATGYPVENGLTSVTIKAKSSITADALSTAAFALGIENGLKLIEEIEDVEAIFTNDDNEVYITDGLKKSFSLTNDDYTLQTLTESNVTAR